MRTIQDTEKTKVELITELEKLRAEVARLNDVERQYCAELDRQVQKRTANLSRSNQALTHEITAHHQLEVALRASQAQLKDILDNVIAAIYSFRIFDTGIWNYEYWSVGGEIIFGYTPDEFMADKNLWRSRVVSEDLAQMLPHPHSETATHFAGRVEYRFRHKDESIRWISCTFKSRRDEMTASSVVTAVAIDISDQKRSEAEHLQAEVALRQAEEKYRSMFESAVVGIFQTTPDGEYLSANETLARMHGYASPDDMIAQISDLDQQLYVQPHRRQIFRQLIETQCQVFEFESEVYCHDGSTIWVSENARAVRDKHNQLLYYEGTSIDITARKRAEEAWHESEKRFQAFMNNSPMVAFIKDASSRLVYANRECERLFSLPQETLVGKSHFDFVGPDIAQRLQASDQQVLTTGQAIELVETIPDATGNLCIWLIYKFPFMSATGQPLVGGVAIDITARQQAETALRQLNEELEFRVEARTQELQASEERFRRAFDHAVTGMALARLDGQWLRVNPALCKILGYSEQELLTLNDQTVSHPDDTEQNVRALRELLAGKVSSVQTETRYLHKLGPIVWVLIGTSLVRDSQGRPLYFVKQIQDITERRAIERMKSEFISVVSHELRTPLASIRGSLGLLAAGVLDHQSETAQQMLSIAAVESERLVRLVNDILDLERLEADIVPLNRQWGDAALIVQRAMAAMQSLAEEHDITLHSIPNPLNVWADHDRIMQTLVNLLSNAIKFSPPGSAITLTVKGLTNQILFQVQDQGRGIPADKLESIFGRFQQVDASDSRDRNGTGLGLAICRNIVQQHGGDIWVESTLGKGSTFYFTLPKTPD
jgi:PAS domain S-box-containing protein